MGQNLRQTLEQSLQLPESANKADVRHLMGCLTEELAVSLKKRYCWLAVCTVAVDAGRWGGERRRKRRLKLAKMAGICAEFIGVENPFKNLPAGWDRIGLYYDYGAVGQYAESTGSDINTVLMVGLQLSGRASRVSAGDSN